MSATTVTSTATAMAASFAAGAMAYGVRAALFPMRAAPRVLWQATPDNRVMLLLRHGCVEHAPSPFINGAGAHLTVGIHKTVTPLEAFTLPPAIGLQFLSSDLGCGDGDTANRKFRTGVDGKTLATFRLCSFCTLSTHQRMDLAAQYWCWTGLMLHCELSRFRHSFLSQPCIISMSDLANNIVVIKK
jgi:hypothetical protein